MRDKSLQIILVVRFFCSLGPFAQTGRIRTTERVDANKNILHPVYVEMIKIGNQSPTVTERAVLEIWCRGFVNGLTSRNHNEVPFDTNGSHRKTYFSCSVVAKRHRFTYNSITYGYPEDSCEHIADLLNPRPTLTKSGNKSHKSQTHRQPKITKKYHHR